MNGIRTTASETVMLPWWYLVRLNYEMSVPVWNNFKLYREQWKSSLAKWFSTQPDEWEKSWREHSTLRSTKDCQIQKQILKIRPLPTEISVWNFQLFSIFRFIFHSNEKQITNVFLSYVFTLNRWWKWFAYHQLTSLGWKWTLQHPRSWRQTVGWSFCEYISVLCWTDPWNIIKIYYCILSWQKLSMWLDFTEMTTTTGWPLFV